MECGFVNRTQVWQIEAVIFHNIFILIHFINAGSVFIFHFGLIKLIVAPAN